MILTRRFTRPETGTGPASLVACAAAMVIAIFIALQSLSLSGQQEIDKRLGPFQNTASLDGVLNLSPKQAQAVPELARAARTVDGRAIVVLQSYDVEPAVVDPPTTYYSEASWANLPFDDRYRLTEGKWPTRPGEVLLADTSTGSLASPGENLEVLAGADSLDVVGLVDDRFGNYRATILAAPGTFAGLTPEPSVGSIPIQALPSLYWMNNKSDRLLTAVADEAATRYGLNSSKVQNSLQASSETAYDVAASRETSWAAQIPAAYLVPSIVLPIIATLGAFGLLRRRHNRSYALLTSIGVSSRVAATALGLATSVWITIGLVVGVFGGLALGIGVRSYLTSVTFQPLSPLPGLAQPVLTMIIAAAVSCFLATSSLRSLPNHPDDEATRSNNGKRRSRLLLNVRHALATVLLCAALLLASQLNSTVRAMILAGLITATLLVMTPEIVSGALRLSRDRGPRTRLARQQLRADPARATLAVVVMATALSLPLGFVMLLGTLSATEATNNGQSAVGPGQVALSGLGGTLQPPPAEVVEAARSTEVLSDNQIRLHYLSDSPNSSPTAIDGAGLGVVWVLDSTQDFQDLRASSVSAEERSTLEGGGILVWDEQQGESRELITGDGEPLPVGSFNATSSIHDPAWEKNSTGVILTKTARGRSLPTVDAAVVFVEVDDRDALMVQDAVLNAGLDPGQVQVFSAPEPPYVPQAFQFAAVALLVIGFATAVVFSRAQVQVLRRYLSTLTALGLPKRWVRHVLLIQNAWIVGVASIIAIGAAIVPTILSATLVPGFILDVAWTRVGIIVETFVVSVLVATVVSIGQVRAADRGVA